MRLPDILTRRRAPFAVVVALGVGVAVTLGVLSLHVLQNVDADERATAAAAAEASIASGALRHVLASFDAAEVAERGYLLTGEPAMRVDLQRALRDLEQAVDAVAAPGLWTATDRVNVDQLVAGARAAAAEFERAVALHDAGDPGAAVALVRNGAAAAYSARMRTSVAAMIDAVAAERAANLDARRRAEVTAYMIALGGFGLRALALLAIGVVVTMQVRAHRASEAALSAGRDAAREADRAKSRFIAAVSHDMRQPLHAIALFIAALRRRSDGEEIEAIVDNIAVATAAMQRTFTALLDVARLDAGAVMVQPRSFSLDELLGALRVRFAPVAAAKGLALDIPANGLALWTDPALLESILGNLLANAVSYTVAGCVTLTARRHEQLLEVQVRDTGPGIAADKLERIFMEFVYLEHASPGGHGVGLGLAIVRLLAGLLGARVGVESVEGTGSVFTVSLPFVPGEAMTQTPRLTAPAPDLAGLRILILDDDPLVLRATASEVADWGARPLPALTATAAMAVMADLAPAAPDGAIIDQDIIGDVSGVAVLDRIGARFGVALPAVIVTGATSAGMREELIDSGHPWLLKPADPEALRRLLADAVAAARYRPLPEA